MKRPRRHRMWGRTGRHLWSHSSLAWRMLAVWFGCMRWSRHNWMQE